MTITRYSYKMLLAAISVAAVWTSCSEDVLSDHTGRVPSGSNTIQFAASIEASADVTRAAVNSTLQPIALTGGDKQLWLVPSVEPTATRDEIQATRGTQLTPSDKLTSFGVSAFKHSATGYNLASCRPDYFYNVEATEILNAQSEGTGVWQLAQTYQWPASDEALTFNAYYPYGNDNVKLTDIESATKNQGPQSFLVQIPSDTHDQVDFMTASTVDQSFAISTAPNASLSFQHHMVAVRFVLGSQFPNGWIKKISISGIYRKGVYTIGSGWTLDANDKVTSANAIGVDYVGPTTTGPSDKQIDTTAVDKSITSAEETFLLIPQEFAQNDAAKITIVFTDTWDDYTVEASLANTGAWQEGTTVTYAISSTYLTALRVSNITFPVTDAGAPKTAWKARTANEDGDMVGMYVVDKDKNIVFENIPVEYVGGDGRWKWQVHHPANSIIYQLGYHYYFYYPYVANRPTGYSLAGHTVGEPATDFFSALISGYNNTTTISGSSSTQGNAASFDAADLQVAKAEADGVILSTIRATMARQVALAAITLGQKSVPNIVNYDLDTDASFTWTKQEGNANVQAGAPSGMCRGTDDRYYRYLKPNLSYEVLSNSETDPWSYEIPATAAGAKSEYTAYSPRTQKVSSQTVSEALLEFTVGGVTFKVAAVGGGSYSQHWTRYNEYDVSVSGTLTSFWMGQTEVTRGLWRAVMGGDKHQDGTALDAQAPAVTSGDANYPQARVSHIDIMGSDGAGTSSSCFIKKLNDAVASQLVAYGLSGRKFNLPSEAQWQWAAMGGRYTHNYTYAGGNDLNAVAWNSGNANSQTHPVSQKVANELKLYDMTGNVWEWCRDWFCSSSTIVTSQGTDYCRTTQGDSSDRVHRGGSWYNGSDWCPVSRRGSHTPSNTYTNLGLRLLLQ